MVVRPERIKWESTSGLKNAVSIVFTPLPGGGSLPPTAEGSSMLPKASMRMTLHFKFFAPRAVLGIFRRLGRLRKYTGDVLLVSMLSNFRDVVLSEVGVGTSTFNVVDEDK